MKTYEDMEKWVANNKGITFVYEEYGVVCTFIPEYADITMDEVKRKTGNGDYAVFGTDIAGEYVSIEDTELHILTSTDDLFYEEMLDL